MSFIVKKKKTVISSPARSCFFLSQIFATLGTITQNKVYKYLHFCKICFTLSV